MNTSSSVSSKSIVYLVAVHVLWSFRSMVRSFQSVVRSFHKIVSSFHMFYLLSKRVNVIRVQSSDRNMDESIFRTIYLMVRALYVNFTMHCGAMWELFTQWWNDLTIDWNDLTMERNDRIPSSLFKIFPLHGIKEN